jgi:two-component system sensor histidine kinase DegS
MVEDITPRKEMEAELSEVKKQLVAGRERERLYLAQELHDEPLQELYGVLYQLEDLTNFTSGDEGHSGVQEAQSAINRIINRLRSICVELRPPTLAHFGLEGAIRELADRYRTEHPEIHLHLELRQDGILLPEQVRLTLYRILQQALNNVHRHAQASEVSIRVKSLPDLMILEVEDNGKGFSVPPRWVSFVREGHLGLAGAAERAEIVNGTFQVISAPDNGTLVRVSMPRLTGEKDSGSEALTG